MSPSGPKQTTAPNTNSCILNIRQSLLASREKSSPNATDQASAPESAEHASSPEPKPKPPCVAVDTSFIPSPMKAMFHRVPPRHEDEYYLKQVAGNDPHGRSCEKVQYKTAGKYEANISSDTVKMLIAGEVSESGHLYGVHWVSFGDKKQDKIRSAVLRKTFRNVQPDVLELRFNNHRVRTSLEVRQPPEEGKKTRKKRKLDHHDYIECRWLVHV